MFRRFFNFKHYHNLVIYMSLCSGLVQDSLSVSTFFGIIIQMFWTEHGPPHFHAVYAEHEAIIDIRELRVARGSLPRRALALVLEWASEHRDARMENWELCRQLKPPRPIPPLE